MPLSTADSPDHDSEPGKDGMWAVPLSDLAVDEAIETAVSRVIRSGWWSMGPTVEEFESAFAEFCGSKHAIAVSSGTAALHLSLLAVGCGRDDEVVVPSLNFVAAANAITHTGAEPVFCDVLGPDDLNLDPRDVEGAITPSTRAIVVLHYGGVPCDISAILDIARAHGVAVVEDAAHAVGASAAGRPCGTFGDVGCFSFFANKNLPVGEGGMVVTDDDELASRIRLLRSHGMTTLTWMRHRGHASTYDVVARGFNYRLDEVRAAIGLVQLERLPRTTAERARIMSTYRERLHGVHGISMPFAAQDSSVSSSHHLAVAILPAETQQYARDALARHRVQTSVHYPPIHRFTEYARPDMRPLPMTDHVAGRILTLPLYPHLREDQLDLVVDGLLDVVAEHSSA